MKEQTRINFRSRKSAKTTSTEINRKKVKVVDEGIITTAFRQPSTIPVEPVKAIQKPEVRKSSRLASILKQSKLPVKKIEKVKNDEVDTFKRKSSISSDKPVAKKLKTLVTTTTNDTKVIEETIINTKKDKVRHKEENTLVDRAKNTNFDEKMNASIDSKDESTSLFEGSTLVDIEDSIPIKTKPQAVNTQEKNVKELDIKNTLVEDQQEDTKHNSNDLKVNQDNLVYTPNEDSPSPPSFLTEPTTPPVQLDTPSAPYKTYINEADKSRIEQEKTTLIKLRKALDIVITDRMARNRPTLYHQIEPVLRNSTRKTITISHLCKAMYLAPTLYQLDVKELRDFGGKVTEAFLVQFGSTWKCPLAGKDLQLRADILANALEEFFLKNKEPNATIPEMKLPRLDLVVDKKEWMKEAKLPPGVKAILEAHKKVDEAEKEKEKPKAKPVGTVKDRMAALRARLAAKKAT